MRARSIARAPAKKRELFFGRDFPIFVLFKMDAHSVLPLSLEPSVKSSWDGVLGYCRVYLSKCWNVFWLVRGSL